MLLSDWRRASFASTPSGVKNLSRSSWAFTLPWAPYLFDNNVDVFSSRIVNYQFDQFAGLMALDQIAVQG